MPKSVNLGKPSGITLKDHTLHVIEQAGYILSKLTFLEKKYKRLVDGNLQKELKDAATFHDWGKAHSQWQKACQ